jgi:hypothetical protein
MPGPPLSAAEQRRRFEELARETGAQTTDEFKKALRIALPKGKMLPRRK